MANLRKFYYILFAISVALNMSFSSLAITSLVSYSTIFIGIVCICLTKRIHLKQKKFWLVTTMFLWVIYCIVSHISINNVDLITSKGRLISVAIISVNIVIFVVLSKQKLSDVFFERNINFFILVFLISVLMTYSFADMKYALSGMKRLGNEISAINLFGMNAAIFALYAFHLFKSASRKKAFYAFLFSIMVILCSMSGSRAALLGIGISVVVYLYFVSDNNKLLTFCKILLFAVIALYLMSWFDFTNGVLERVSTIWSKNDSSIAYSDAGRMSLITTGLQLWLEKPIFGHGFNTYTLYSSSVIGFSTYSHNNYIELLVNCGLLGFCIYYIPRVVIFVNAVKTAKKEKSNLVYFFASTMILLFLFDMTIVSYYYLALNFIWCFSAVISDKDN